MTHIFFKIIAGVAAYTGLSFFGRSRDPKVQAVIDDPNPYNLSDDMLNRIRSRFDAEGWSKINDAKLDERTANV